MDVQGAHNARRKDAGTEVRTREAGRCCGSMRGVAVGVLVCAAAKRRHSSMFACIPEHFSHAQNMITFEVTDQEQTNTALQIPRRPPHTLGKRALI